MDLNVNHGISALYFSMSFPYPSYHYERSTGYTLSYSNRPNSPKYRSIVSPIPMKDLTDSEEDTITITPTSPILSKSTCFSDQVKHVETTNHTEQQDPWIGFTILFSVLLFIAVHIIPILDWIPHLLRRKMGPFISSSCLCILSLCLGHQSCIHKQYLHSQLLLVTKHKAYKNIKKLLVLGICLYLSRFTTSWMFSIFYQLHVRIPILGTMMVLGVLLWCTLILVVSVIWMGACISWRIASLVLGKKSVSKKRRSSILLDT